MVKFCEITLFWLSNIICSELYQWKEKEKRFRDCQQVIANSSIEDPQVSANVGVQNSK